MPVCSVFFLNCHHVWSGRCKKNSHFCSELSLFRTKVQLFIQNSLPRACAPNNKNKIVVHPTNHGNAHFGPIQQPTNNLAALASLTCTIIANSLRNFILVDCYLATFFLNLVKLPHHGHVDHDNCDFETAVQSIQPRPLG
jgi:hypothetical protein